MSCRHRSHISNEHSQSYYVHVYCKLFKKFMFKIFRTCVLVARWRMLCGLWTTVLFSLSVWKVPLLSIVFLVSWAFVLRQNESIHGNSSKRTHVTNKRCQSGSPRALGYLDRSRDTHAEGIHLNLSRAGTPLSVVKLASRYIVGKQVVKNLWPSDVEWWILYPVFSSSEFAVQ